VDSKILSIGGSGVRFPAYLGAYSVLRNHYNFDEFIGISGGAISTAFLAIGNPFEEVVQTVFDLNFKSFLKRNWGWPIYGTSRFRASAIIKCLDDLYEGKCMGDTKYHLSLISYDLASQQEVIFSSSATPDVKVSFAVKSSMCIPLIIEAQSYNGYEYLVDGGVSNNLGVDLCHGKDFIGMKTKSPSEETLYKSKWLHTVFNVDMIVNALMDSLDKEHMDDVDAASKMVWIPCSVSSLNFGINKEEKMTLYDEGINAANKFLVKNFIPTMGKKIF
jgi:NTE family protein